MNAAEASALTGEAVSAQRRQAQIAYDGYVKRKIDELDGLIFDKASRGLHALTVAIPKDRVEAIVSEFEGRGFRVAYAPPRKSDSTGNWSDGNLTIVWQQGLTTA